MTKFQFEAPDDLWQKWKKTVPRDQALDERIRELLAADAEGRVVDDDQETLDDVDRADAELIHRLLQGDQEAERAVDADPRTDAPQESQEPVSAEGDGLEDLPQHVDQEAAEAAVLAARDLIRERGSAAKGEIVPTVMPEHPLGYDLPEIEDGELVDRFKGSWWRKVVRPGLEALDDVEKPGAGQSEWRHSPG